MANLSVFFVGLKSTPPLFWNSQPIEEPLGDILDIAIKVKARWAMLGFDDVRKITFLIKPTCGFLLVDEIEITRSDGSTKSLIGEQISSVFPITPAALSKFLTT
jgi:hypothetical protein